MGSDQNVGMPVDPEKVQYELLAYHHALLVEIKHLPFIMALDLLTRKLDIAFLKLRNKHPSFDWNEAACLVDVLRHTVWKHNKSGYDDLPYLTIDDG